MLKLNAFNNPKQSSHIDQLLSSDRSNQGFIGWPVKELNSEISEGF